MQRINYKSDNLFMMNKKEEIRRTHKEVRLEIERLKHEYIDGEYKAHWK